MEINKMTLELMLKETREIENITQAELAKVLNVHPQYISNMERGEAQLPLKYFKKVSKTLGIKLSLMVKARLEDTEREIMATLNISRPA
jgi:transcriptional regulator with XRE-family HTH domain